MSDNAQRPDVSVSGLDEFVTTYIDRANGEPTRRYNDFDFEIQLNFIDTEGDIDGDGDDDHAVRREGATIAERGVVGLAELEAVDEDHPGADVVAEPGVARRDLKRDAVA